MSEMNTSEPMAETGPMQPLNTTAPGGKKIDGMMLKCIAMIIMVIDHVGAFVVTPYIATLQDPAAWLTVLEPTLRAVGRIAFPMFCFLIVEGYFHTHDRRKYLLQMLIFGIISEPIFDFANNYTWFSLENQNIFFTLALGLLSIWGLDVFTAKGKPILGWCGVVLFSLTALLCRTDYVFAGVVLIVTFYLFRGKKSLYIAIPVVLFCGQFLTWSILFYDYYIDMGAAFLSMVFMSSLQEAFGAVSLIFIAQYNGQRGRKLPKYLFYAFYPVHILILCGIRYLMIGM